MNTESSDGLKLFSGTSNPALAQAIAKELSAELSAVEIKRFEDGETSVLIQESVRGSDVFVVQSTSPPVNESVMELVLIIDALKRASAGKITAVVPYYGYARQDRLTGRSPISAKIVADLIVASGADSFCAVDLHSKSIQGYFNIPVDDLTSIPLLAQYFRSRMKDCSQECVVVSPDVGGVKRARDFSRLLGCPLAIIDKQRPKPNAAEVSNVIGEVSGKTAILVDDMADTGGSLVAGAKALQEKGAGDVYAAVTHGVFSPPAFERIAASSLKELVVTDSIPLKKDAPSRIRALSLAPLIASVIKRLHLHESVSEVYQQ